MGHCESWEGSVPALKGKRKKKEKKYQQSSEERKYDSKLVNTESFKGQDKYKFLNEGI